MRLPRPRPRPRSRGPRSALSTPPLPRLTCPAPQPRSDQIIEQATKTTIPEIFASEGEDGFRQIETDVLAEVASYKKCVVATGGGVVKRRENWMHLRNGVPLCLNGDPELLASRISKDGVEARPPVQGGEGRIRDCREDRRDDGGARQALRGGGRHRQASRGDDGGEGENLDQLNARVLTCLKKRVAEDDTKQRLKNEPKPGDIKVTGA